MKLNLKLKGSNVLVAGIARVAEAVRHIETNINGPESRLAKRASAIKEAMLKGDGTSANIQLDLDDQVDAIAAEYLELGSMYAEKLITINGLIENFAGPAIKDAGLGIKVGKYSINIKKDKTGKVIEEAIGTATSGPEKVTPDEKAAHNAS